MKLTKYGHACFSLEINGKRLLVDPGEMTPDYGGNNNIVALVITHEHFDHFNEQYVKQIIAANPEVKIFTTPEVAQKLNGSIAVKAGDKVEVGAFKLEFFGQMHQQVHPDFPTCQNIGVMINNKIYYGGDSFVLPGKPVELLLAPTSGPWQKMSEVMNMIAAIKPKQVVPTHNGLYCDAGQKIAASWLKMLAQKHPFELSELGAGESADVLE